MKLLCKFGWFTACLFLSACAATGTKTTADSPFPAHWWAVVPEMGMPAWEILPQAAGPGEVILSKRNELGLLSNFAPTPFTYRGKRYASLEGFWQMMLYPEGKKDPRVRRGVTWKYTRAEVSRMTAFEAKKAGDLASANLQKLGITWVSFEGERFPYQSVEKGRHYQIIREAMWEKLRQNAEVKKVLLSTGNLVLKPDHHNEVGSPPEWRYYEIYSEFRDELRAEN